MAGRGLYGQVQGDANRTATACMGERIADNQVVEGDAIARLKAMLSQKRFDAASEFMERLRTEGYADHRIRAIYGMASAGVRF